MTHRPAPRGPRTLATTAALLTALTAPLAGCTDTDTAAPSRTAPTSAGSSTNSPATSDNPDPKPTGTDPSPALSALVTKGRAPGAAALARRDGSTRFTTAGVADTRTDRRIHRADRFRAGSITKTFTAVVLLQLAAEKKLSLDDTVEQHLPGLVRGHGNNGRRITLRQLLNHTSGLPNYTADPDNPATPLDRTLTPASLVRFALTHPPDFAPGSKFAYSNTNYILLGMITEKVTGHGYAEEATRRILKPLKLTGTSYPGTRRDLPAPHGSGYTGTPDAPRDRTDLNPSGAGAAGELITTLNDLNRFYTALLSGELLPPTLLTQMRDVHATKGKYGLGLFPVVLSCTIVWGHNGTITGSAVDTFGTKNGSHVLTYRVNADWLAENPDLERPFLEAEFCP
ncbi:serine hydrolase domain-containing protein [Streptomyces sp. NBC_01304]|uniref:serine hydrolase domain-containing protein n=1 Tax=Streptomyces sp. NBC_01304 TaxID=2903818 RepID=UPI002E138ADC|nr:beta-lactamase family protein [Streptomyces sp. NBC_01304]